MSKIYLISCFVLLFLLGNKNIYAQGTETVVRGKVIDQTTNKPLSEVNIIAKDESTGSIVGTTTNLDGTFLIKELPVGGPYVFEISLIGFSDRKFKGQQLAQGTTIDLGNIILSESKALNEVTVIGTKANFTDRKEAGSVLAISRRILDLIPTPSRDFKDLANFSPQASIPINKERYGISIAGVKSTSVGYTIDGVNARRGVFGGTSTDAAFIISQEAVE
ncbi:MAG: carboxypeptidase regulatory-like domain-containing protein, partial [Tenacibaculum sp.]